MFTDSSSDPNSPPISSASSLSSPYPSFLADASVLSESGSFNEEVVKRLNTPHIKKNRAEFLQAWEELVKIEKEQGKTATSGIQTRRQLSDNRKIISEKVNNTLKLYTYTLFEKELNPTGNFGIETLTVAIDNLRVYIGTLKGESKELNDLIQKIKLVNGKENEFKSRRFRVFRHELLIKQVESEEKIVSLNKEVLTIEAKAKKNLDQAQSNLHNQLASLGLELEKGKEDLIISNTKVKDSEEQTLRLIEKNKQQAQEISKLQDEIHQLKLKTPLISQLKKKFKLDSSMSQDPNTSPTASTSNLFSFYPLNTTTTTVVTSSPSPPPIPSTSNSLVSYPQQVVPTTSITSPITSTMTTVPTGQDAVAFRLGELFSREDKKSIPFFKGSSSDQLVTEWLKEAERTARNNNWTDEQKIRNFSDRLKSEAADWHVEYLDLKTTPANPTLTNYNEWKEDLIKRFIDEADLDKLRSKLQKLKQLPEQKTKAFIGKINSLYDSIYGKEKLVSANADQETKDLASQIRKMRDQEKMKVLLRGLLPKIKQELRSRIKQDTTYEEMCKLASVAENVVINMELSEEKGINAVIEGISHHEIQQDKEIEILRSKVEQLSTAINSTNKSQEKEPTIAVADIHRSRSPSRDRQSSRPGGRVHFRSSDRSRSAERPNREQGTVHPYSRGRSYSSDRTSYRQRSPMTVPQHIYTYKLQSSKFFKTFTLTTTEQKYSRKSAAISV